jgi:hypothetical protein
MIGALIATLSLYVTNALVFSGQVAGTLPITAATATTPITVTSTAHGIPPARVMHAVISGVTGETEANGLWELSVVDANTLSLGSYSPQGVPQASVGVNAYTGGGTISYAFPDYQILVGRQMLALASSAASPRIVMIPTRGPAWLYESYGSVALDATTQKTRGTLEEQTMRQHKLYATQPKTFEVYITGAASPPSPNFGDFDAVDALVETFYQVLFEACTPDIAQILHEDWPSQYPTAGANTQRGQQWMGILQIKQPIKANALAFVPAGTSLVMTVEPTNAGSTDPVTFTVSGVS